MSDFQPTMYYFRKGDLSDGLYYRCYVAYRPIEEIEDMDDYRRRQLRAMFVDESVAQWFCKQFNDAIAQKVEPFQLGNKCVGFDSSLASPPTAALAARQMRDAAVKVCREYGESVNNDWNKQLGVADDLVSIAEECAEAIATLPVPEIQWRDLTDEEIVELGLTDKFWNDHFGYSEFDSEAFARAVIAKFKEKQL